MLRKISFVPSPRIRAEQEQEECRCVLQRIIRIDTPPAGGAIFLCCEPIQARSFRIKEAVPLAALPSTHNDLVLKAIQPAYPLFIDGVDLLHTGLNNMEAIFHPA
jgi:hypothetical protein